MHSAVVALGIVAYTLLALAVLSIVVGIVWTAFPLKNKIYTGIGEMYRYSTPMGGRKTGLIILGSGLAGLILGLFLDRTHTRLARKYGARI